MSITEAGVFGREGLSEQLSHVFRYRNVEKVVHRFNLLEHSNRVSYIAGDIIIPLLKLEDNNIFIDFNPGEVSIGSDLHDVQEIITGDIPLNEKEQMSDRELALFREAEQLAVEKIFEKYFSNNDSIASGWIKLACEKAINKQIAAGQIIKIADTLDCLYEKTHEIFCGNGAVFLEMIDRSKRVIASFESFPIWKYIKDFELFGLNNIPSVDEFKKLPTIKNKKELSQKSFLEKIEPWPQYYKYALGTCLNYEHQIQNIYPGWYGRNKTVPLTRQLELFSYEQFQKRINSLCL